jgi:hypothetical protein
MSHRFGRQLESQQIGSQWREFRGDEKDQLFSVMFGKCHQRVGH